MAATRQRLLAALVCAAALLAAGGAVRGSVFLSFDLDQSDYLLQPGQSAAVRVYLQEMTTDPDSSLFAAEDGLWTAGVLVQRTDSSLGAAATITGAAANTAAFDDLPPMITLAADEAAIFEMALDARPHGVGAPEDPPESGLRRIVLGEFTVTGGTVAGEVTTFQVADNSTDDTRTWATFQLLDPDIAATSFTVTTVPEPATLALLAAGLAALLRRRR